jgi:hypothetical protein
MPFSPDIIVTRDDGSRILLVVEARRAAGIHTEDESQLKFYMIQMRCPTGLLITPETIQIFRDRYTGHSEESVERIGNFPAPGDWEVFKAPHHGSQASGSPDGRLEERFEEAVRFWLEELSSSPSAKFSRIPRDTGDALADYVIPALAEGVVRSGGPRHATK